VRADGSSIGMSATRLPIAAAAAILVVLGAIFTLGGVRSAESVLHPPSASRSVQATLPHPGGGANGWTWSIGVPGFRFGGEERFWNGVETSSAKRTRIQANARASGMAVETTRILKAVWAAPSQDQIALIAASKPGRDEVCLAFAGHGFPQNFTCMRSDTRAANSSAFIAASTWNGTRKGLKVHTLELIGVARGDIIGIDFSAPGLGVWPIYHRSIKFAWGTFALGVELPRPWTGYLTLRRRGGALERVPLRSTDAGRRVLLPIVAVDSRP
jgi:hypothetical protein